MKFTTNIIVFIASLILLAGCSSFSNGKNRFGVRISFPDNWRRISAEEAGQLDTSPELDRLRLGYFNPVSGEQEGTFIYSVFGSSKSKEYLQKHFDRLSEGMDHRTWKGIKCRYEQIGHCDNPTGKEYRLVYGNALLNFVFAQSEECPKGIITEMENNVHFEQAGKP